MQEITVSSIENLRTTLAAFKGDTLFRGQTAHFEHKGHTPVVTSFDRKGCIPSEMLRWSHNADKVSSSAIKRIPRVVSA